MKTIAGSGFFFLSQIFDIVETIYIHMCMCHCKTKFFKDRLKNMSLNVKIITKSVKSPDPLILEMNGRI